MRPSANWQYLLLSQITRGAFMIDPRHAIGLGDHVSHILSKDKPFAEVPEREDFKIKLFNPSEGSINGQSGFQMAVSQSDSSYDSVPKGSTAIFSIHGTMLKYGTWCDYGTEEIAGFIREAVHHKNIGSIVLDVDSGGGSVSAIPPLLQVIEEAKAAGKPVVASVDLCASAALYTASACNSIIATNSVSSEIGSIGVMISFWDVIPKYEAEGYKFHKIYATQSTDKNQAFEMALEGKYDLIKSELLDPLAIEFQNHFKAARSGKLNEEIPGILTGKTFFAKQALEYGMIDEIGPLDLAVERAQQLAEAIQFSNNYKS